MDERLNRWEVPFQRALILVDSVRKIEIPVDDWTFGGGTVLMRRTESRCERAFATTPRSLPRQSYLPVTRFPRLTCMTAIIHVVSGFAT